MVFQMNKWSIVRGQDEQILVFLLGVDGHPINISGASEINLLLVNQDQSILEIPAYQGISVGLTNPIWIYAFSLTADQTKALSVLQNQNVEVKIKFGILVRFLPIMNSLSVSDPII